MLLCCCIFLPNLFDFDGPVLLFKLIGTSNIKGSKNIKEGKGVWPFLLFSHLRGSLQLFFNNLSQFFVANHSSGDLS